MKKLIALMLSLMMLMGSVGALAEVDYENGFEMDFSMELDHAMITNLVSAFAGQETVPADALDAVLGLVEAVSVKMAFDNTTLDLDVNLNNTPILTLEGGSLSDGSLAVTTNMLSKYAIGMNADMMNQLRAEMEKGMSGLDMEKIEKAAEKLEDDFEALMEKTCTDLMNADFVKTEKGAYVMNGITFATMITAETDTNKLVEVLAGFMEEALPLVETFAAEAQIPEEFFSLNELKADLNVNPDAQPVPVYVTVYQDAEGFEDYAYITFEMADDQAALAMAVAAFDKETEVVMYFGEGTFESAEQIAEAAYAGQGNGVVMEMAFLQGENDEDMNAVISLVSGGVFMGYYVETKAVDGGVDSLMELYFINDEAPLATFKMAVRELTEKLPVVNVEGKQVLDATELETMDQDTQNALMLDLQTGLSGLLVNAVQAAPDEVQALIGMLMVTE